VGFIGFFKMQSNVLANLLASSKSEPAKFTKHTSETIHIMQDH